MKSQNVLALLIVFAIICICSSVPFICIILYYIIGADFCRCLTGGHKVVDVLHRGETLQRV